MDRYLNPAVDTDLSFCEPVGEDIRDSREPTGAKLPTQHPQTFRTVSDHFSVGIEVGRSKRRDRTETTMFHLASSERAKRIALDLKTELDTRGIPVKLSEAQELTAKMLWYGSWQDLVRNHAADAPSADDEFVPKELAASRRRHHVEVLKSAGIIDRAEDLVKIVRPTDRSARSPSKVPALSLLGIANIRDWQRAVDRHSGLCLVSGPGKSGLSTTLASTFQYLRDSGRKVALIGSSLQPGPYDEDLPRPEKRTLLHDEYDCLVYLDAKNLGEVLSQSSSQLVVAPVQATSYAHLMRRLVSLGLDHRDVRHVLRCVLMQTLLAKLETPEGTTYSGKAMVSEVVTIDRPAVFDTIQEPFYSRADVMVKEALQLREISMVDDAELYRAFGDHPDIASWNARLSSRMAEEQ